MSSSLTINHSQKRQLVSGEDKDCERKKSLTKTGKVNTWDFTSTHHKTKQDLFNFISQTRNRISEEEKKYVVTMLDSSVVMCGYLFGLIPTRPFSASSSFTSSVSVPHLYEFHNLGLYSHCSVSELSSHGCYGLVLPLFVFDSHLSEVDFDYSRQTVDFPLKKIDSISLNNKKMLKTSSLPALVRSDESSSSSPSSPSSFAEEDKKLTSPVTEVEMFVWIGSNFDFDSLSFDSSRKKKVGGGGGRNSSLLTHSSKLLPLSDRNLTFYSLNSSPLNRKLSERNTRDYSSENRRRLAQVCCSPLFPSLSNSFGRKALKYLSPILPTSLSAAGQAYLNYAKTFSKTGNNFLARSSNDSSCLSNDGGGENVKNASPYAERKRWASPLDKSLPVETTSLFLSNLPNFSSDRRLVGSNFVPKQINRRLLMTMEPQRKHIPSKLNTQQLQAKIEDRNSADLKKGNKNKEVFNRNSGSGNKNTVEKKKVKKPSTDLSAETEKTSELSLSYHFPTRVFTPLSSPTTSNVSVFDSGPVISTHSNNHSLQQSILSLCQPLMRNIQNCALKSVEMMIAKRNMRCIEKNVVFETEKDNGLGKQEEGANGCALNEIFDGIFKNICVDVYVEMEGKESIDFWEYFDLL
jgi:hypothetical protein